MISVTRHLEREVTILQNGFLYTALVALLALVSLGFLVYEWLPGANEAWVELGDELDLYVAYIFLIDFVLGHFFNKHYVTKQLYWRDNWMNLLSSIPVNSELTQMLRVVRLLRAARVLRVIVNVWTTKQQFDQHKAYQKSKNKNLTE